MRDLICTENITVDGVIEATEGWFDVVADDQLADLIEAQAEQRESADALLVGRETFEAFRGYWPNQTDDETGVSDYLNRVSKYVVSSTVDDPGWEGTTVITGSPVEQVRELKSEPGKDIVVTGSITLVRELVGAGLVDEYRLFVYPVVLGRGQRLFEDATEVPALELVETRAFRSGIVLVRYRPARG